MAESSWRQNKIHPSCQRVEWPSPMLERLVKETRTCHLKICHFGIRMVLNWRAENQQMQEELLLHLFYLKQGMNFSLWQCSPFPNQKESDSCYQRWRMSAEMSLHKQNLMKLTFISHQFPHVFPTHFYVICQISKPKSLFLAKHGI